MHASSSYLQIVPLNYYRYLLAKHWPRCYRVICSKWSNKCQWNAVTGRGKEDWLVFGDIWNISTSNTTHNKAESYKMRRISHLKPFLFTGHQTISTLLLLGCSISLQKGGVTSLRLPIIHCWDLKRWGQVWLDYLGPCQRRNTKRQTAAAVQQHLGQQP